MTCKGRAHHARETLPHSFACLGAGDEIVLLDYASTDGLAGWVMRECEDMLRSGLFNFYKLSGNRPFHASHAKNVAHRLGKGNVLCNLDADNTLTLTYVAWLRRIFGQGSAITVPTDHDYGGGFGRIALTREDFHALGGYDEALQGWGYEDNDLLLRAGKQGIRGVPIPRGVVQFKRHEDSERVLAAGTNEVMQSRRKNEKISQAAIDAGRIVANRGVRWGRAENLQHNFSGLVTV